MRQNPSAPDIHTRSTSCQLRDHHAGLDRLGILGMARSGQSVCGPDNRLERDLIFMALTESTMTDLGSTAPAFELPDVTSGKTVTLASFQADKALLVMFICNHCPFVKHVHEELARIGRDYASKPIGIVAVNANNVETHPDDAPDKMKATAAEWGLTFPYCYDEDQQTAKAYGAACTPDFFLFDSERRLVYRGQLDDSRPENDKPATGSDLRAAIDAILEGRSVSAGQKPSIGCNIKWKPGNEPSYAASV